MSGGQWVFEMHVTHPDGTTFTAVTRVSDDRGTTVETKLGPSEAVRAGATAAVREYIEQGYNNQAAF